MVHSKQITYNTAGSIISLFAQWMIMMLIPKMTDFSEAGVFAVAISICSILNIFATFSLNQYQISDQYRRYDENTYRAARIVTIAISFIVCLAMMLFFGYSTEQNLVIFLYMIYRNLLHYAFLYTATLQIRERLDFVGKCMMLEGGLSLISFISVYHITNDLILSTAAMAVAGGGSFLISVAYGYRRATGTGIPTEHADGSSVRSMLYLGIPLLLSGVIPIIITALPKIMLQAAAGDAIVGIFSTLSTPTIVVPTLITAVFTPFIVYFSNIVRKGDISTLRKQYMKMVAVILLFGAICYILSRFAGGFVFEMVYGDDIVPYVGYFDVLIVGITLYSIGMCSITMLVIKEQGRAAAISSAVALTISILIFISVIPENGIHGATYGLTAAYGIFGLIVTACVMLLPLDRGARAYHPDSE